MPSRVMRMMTARTASTYRAYSISTKVLRLGGIYGAGRNYMLRKLMRGRMPMPGQTHYTNRIHRDDAVGARP